MRTFIGVDLGGTNVRVAKVDEVGNILQIEKEKTEIEQGCDFVVHKIISMIERLDGYKQCIGIGMGVPGPVDTKLGAMVMATNLPGFKGYPLVEKLQSYFQLPTFLDNDVNVAGMGEAMLGAGVKKNIVYYVTISTGIGGALVINERLVSGKHGYAGEVGNIVIDRNREKVNHLNKGAVENEASGTALTRKGKKIFGDDIQHAGDVFALARKGDVKANQLCDEMAYDVACLLSVIAHVVDPDIFILGGGVMKGKDIFLDKVKHYYAFLVHEGMQDVQFVEAVLMEPGIVGAAMLVKAYVK